MLEQEVLKLRNDMLKVTNLRTWFGQLVCLDIYACIFIPVSVSCQYLLVYGNGTMFFVNQSCICIIFPLVVLLSNVFSVG